MNVKTRRSEAPTLVLEATLNHLEDLRDDDRGGEADRQPLQADPPGALQEPATAHARPRRRVRPRGVQATPGREERDERSVDRVRHRMVAIPIQHRAAR